MEIVEAKIVQQKLDQQSRPAYSDHINQLPVGGALKIHPSAWPRRESIYHFFLTRYKGQVTVRHLSDGYFYVIKL